MKLFNFERVVTKNPEKIVDDLSHDSEISDKLTRFMDNLGKHKNKDTVEFDHIRIQILEEYVNLGYSLSKIHEFLDKYKLLIDFGDSIILRSACYKGNLKFVKLLIQEYGDIIKLDLWDQSPIKYAVQSGNLGLVDFLLGFAQVDPKSPIILTLAVIGNHYEIVERLLEDKRVNPERWDYHALKYVNFYHRVNPDQRITKLFESKLNIINGIILH